MVFSSFLRRGHDDQQVATDSIHQHWPYYDHGEGPRAFVDQIRSLNVNDTLDIAADLPSLGLPAALVWGDADPFQKVSYAHRLARDLSTEVDRIAGGKHFVPEDHPERVAAAVRSVLERGG
jgi:pimeloyl-ACP methyl ester carboxylesterase